MTEKTKDQASNTPTPPPTKEVATPPSKRREVVQLTRNFKGRQFGETFTREQATKLGVIEHCRPFTGQDDRQLKPGDAETH